MSNTTTTIQNKSDFTAEELETINNEIGSGWKMIFFHPATGAEGLFAFWTSACTRCSGTGIWRGANSGTCYRCGGMQPQTRETRCQSIKRIVNRILKIRQETPEQRTKRLNKEAKAEAKRKAEQEAIKVLREKQYQEQVAKEKAERKAEAKAEAKKQARFDALWETLDLDNRTQVTGKVLCRKYKVNAFGGAYKMLVELDSGIKIWGTDPSICEVGDVVQFDCRLQRSDRDMDFGFFKRPTKLSKT